MLTCPSQQCVIQCQSAVIISPKYRSYHTQAYWMSEFFPKISYFWVMMNHMKTAVRAYLTRSLALVYRALFVSSLCRLYRQWLYALRISTCLCVCVWACVVVKLSRRALQHDRWRSFGWWWWLPWAACDSSISCCSCSHWCWGGAAGGVGPGCPPVPAVPRNNLALH